MPWPSFCPEPCAAVAYHRDATNAAALAGGRHRRSGPFGGMNKLDAAQARYGKRMSLRPPPAAQPAPWRRVRQRSGGEVCGAIPHRVGVVDHLPLRIAPLAPGSSWTRYPSVAAEGLTCDRSQLYDRITSLKAGVLTQPYVLMEGTRSKVMSTYPADTSRPIIVLQDTIRTGDEHLAGEHLMRITAPS